VILVILAACLEVNQAKRKSGSSRSSSSSSSSSPSRSYSSSSSSSSSSRGSSFGSRAKNVATKVKNALKPKPKPVNTNPQSSYPKQQYGTNTDVPSSSSSSGSSKSTSIGSKIKNVFKPKSKVPSSSPDGLPKPKKESKVKKRLKQAALIGAGAYVGYKLGKLKEKFSSRNWDHGFDGHDEHSSSNVHISIGGSSGGHSSGHGVQPRYNFDTWNNWREADGFLCRTNDDCKWLDQNLNCEGAEFEFSPAAGWYGGDTASIVGECSCEEGFRWNEGELRCDRVFQPAAVPGSRPQPPPSDGSIAAGVIIGIVLGILFGICCCVSIGCIICKKIL